MANWHIAGQYMETCNCNYICPCIGSNLKATPTEGECKAALAMRIDEGEKDGVRLDGVAFIVLAHAPGAMEAGNWKVGLIIDEGASEAQVEAIAAITSGDIGGPMEMLAPLVGEVAGIERRPITFRQDGMKYHVVAGDLIDQSLTGVPTMFDETQPLYIDNVAHPANTRLALAKADSSTFRAFGIEWNDASGTRNGHFAPFSWSS